jgi:hypothetical protein
VESTATALPYSSTVTSSPLFIVGMVLLAAIIIIVLIVALYIRHQNRCEKSTTGCCLPPFPYSSSPPRQVVITKGKLKKL